MQKVMSCGSFVGRVGGLAVALGVGAAVFTGSGVAWATEDSAAATKADTAETSPKADGPNEASGENAPAEEAELEPEAQPELVVDEPDAVDEPDEVDEPDDVIEDDESESEPDEAPSADDEAAVTQDDESAEPDIEASVEPEEPDHVVTRKAQSEAPSSAPARATAATSVAPPQVPSWRPYPTAFDLRSAVTYVVDLAGSVVRSFLQPFAAGAPKPPTDPSLWGLLAWVRRELFNGSPTDVENPLPQTQSLTVDGDVVVTGNVGVEDPDGDVLTYTVIGRPHNGGTVVVDAAGNFVYRPMNAMAAVGGTDTFTVAVSDEQDGLHVHGLLGLLRFVPIIGSFLNPGGGHGISKTIAVNITPVAGVDLSLPDDFRWGVAHSGFQAEGGPGAPVDTRSDWYRWVHDPLNRLLGLVKGVPEDGPGAYVSYEDDAVLARDELGMDTFRMSIEWSRIFPNSTAEVDISDEGGALSEADLQALDALADQDEVAHYRAVFAALRRHGLDPFVTINHFTLPVWVHDPIASRPLIQLGLPAPKAGWLSDGTAGEFEKYAAYLAWKYGDQVDNWATLNEPFSPVLTEFLAIPWVVPNWPPGVNHAELHQMQDF